MWSIIVVTTVVRRVFDSAAESGQANGFVCEHRPSSDVGPPLIPEHVAAGDIWLTVRGAELGIRSAQRMSRIRPSATSATIEPDSHATRMAFFEHFPLRDRADSRALAMACRTNSALLSLQHRDDRRVWPRHDWFRFPPTLRR